jgi:hypothetical protein
MNWDAPNAGSYDAMDYPFPDGRVQQRARQLRPELLITAASRIRTSEEGIISGELRRDVREHLRRTYYHEAGHAVALQWFGFRPTGITMNRTHFDPVRSSS